MNCRICDSAIENIQWSMGKSAYGDAFKSSRSEAISLSRQSLTLATCDNCGFCQILENPDENLLYREYTYQTKVTNNLDLFYENLVKNLLSAYFGQGYECDFVLDVGSGDGSFLKLFKEMGKRTLGIEPSMHLCRYSHESGIETICEFFQRGISASVIQNFGFPDLISANYVFANSNQPLEFLQEVQKLMGPNTVLSILTGYHPDQFAVNMFDYVGHDHVSYFSLKDIENLSTRVGLKVIEAQRYEHKGGSLHLVLTLDSESSIYSASPNVYQLRQREIWTEQTKLTSILSLRNRVETERGKLAEYLKQNRISRLSGIGASTSTTYLINFLGIENKLSELYDDDPQKIGKYSPGHGIPVIPLRSALDSNSDALIILAWQHTNRIIQRLTDLGFTGRVMTPLPTFKVIEI